MYINGPAGQLEADLRSADDDNRTIAILCHPHPLYGGSMHDMVLDTAASAFLANGVGALRFNFRGVGGSDGDHDQGVGEVDDLAAVHAWVCKEVPGAQIWLAGYSFGASIVWKSLDGLRPVRAFLIAPPNAAMPFETLSTDAPVVAFAGSEDEYVNPGNLQDLDGLDCHTIEGADHFFSGRHAELRAAIEASLAP